MPRRKQRYPSDTSDAQWELVEPLLPEAIPGGRPEKDPRRAVVDAILYVVCNGCAWRSLPADFPPWQTVYWYFNRWEQATVTEAILPVVHRPNAGGRTAERLVIDWYNPQGNSWYSPDHYTNFVQFYLLA